MRCRMNLQWAQGFLLGILIALISPNTAYTADDDDDAPDVHRIPKVGQPASEFYNAAGSGVTLRLEATPTQLTTREWLTLKLTVGNLFNAPDIEKPSLKKLPDFATFQIEEGAELDSKIDPRVLDHRVFIYKLRPSSENVKLVPAIAFYYYDPKIRVPAERPQLAFPKKYTNAIPIEVNSAGTDDQPPPTPLDVPDFATNLASGDALTVNHARSLNWLWQLVLIAPPLVAIGWVLAWRRLYPDSARLAQIRRNKAVRHALSRLAVVKRADRATIPRPRSRASWSRTCTSDSNCPCTRELPKKSLSRFIRKQFCPRPSASSRQMPFSATATPPDSRPLSLTQCN